MEQKEQEAIDDVKSVMYGAAEVIVDGKSKKMSREANEFFTWINNQENKQYLITESILDPFAVDLPYKWVCFEIINKEVTGKKITVTTEELYRMFTKNIQTI